MISRIRRLGSALLVAVSVLALVAAAGCKGGREAPLKTRVQVVNAAPTSPQLTFLRGQHVEAQLNYLAGSSVLNFDVDTYDFNVQTTYAGSFTPTQLASFTDTVEHGTNYLFVLTEVSGAIAPIVLESPADHDAASVQISAVHAAPAAASVDVYLLPPGGTPAAATPLGSFAFQGTLPPTDRAAGEYQLVLTEAGQAANEIFRSRTIKLNAGESHIFILAEGIEPGLASLTVIDSTPISTGAFFDADTQAGIILVNAAADGTAKDIYLDNATTPLVTDIANPGMTGLVTIPPGEHTLRVSPVGNPGVSTDLKINAAQGWFQSVLISGEPGELALAALPNDARFVAGQARIQLMNGASAFVDGLDFVVVASGSDFDNAPALSRMKAPAISQRSALPPGEYQMIVRDPTTGATVGGPVTLNLAAGLYTILATNGATPGTASIVVLQAPD